MYHEFDNDLLDVLNVPRINSNDQAHESAKLERQLQAEAIAERRQSLNRLLTPDQIRTMWLNERGTR